MEGAILGGVCLWCIVEDVQMANQTYFSLWYRFVLFQKEIQIIAIAVLKNCTKPDRSSKNTSLLIIAAMYKTCYRERFKQNFLRFNIVLNHLLQN